MDKFRLHSQKCHAYLKDSRIDEAMYEYHMLGQILEAENKHTDAAKAFMLCFYLMLNDKLYVDMYVVGRIGFNCSRVDMHWMDMEKLFFDTVEYDSVPRCYFSPKVSFDLLVLFLGGHTEFAYERIREIAREHNLL